MGVFRFNSAFLAGVALTASPAFAQDAPPAATAKVDAGQAAAEPAQTDAEAPTGDFTLDFIGGWGKALGPIDFDVNATYYYYPGAHSLDYVEFISTASHTFGQLTLGTTFAYTPKQGDAAPSRGLYGAVNAAYAIPKTPLTVSGSFGIEDNAFFKKKKDRSIGVSAEVVGFTVGASYVEAGHIGAKPLGKGRFLLSPTRSFLTSY